MDREGRRTAHVLLLALLVLAVELVLALYNPRWNNPDELSHAQFVLFLRDHSRLPDPYREDVKVQQDKHPPLAYAAAAAVLRLTHGLFDATRGDEEWQLPGRYDARIRPHRFMADVGFFEGQLYLIRILFALFSVGTALYLFGCARLVLPGQTRLAWSLAGTFALIPQVALSGASLTPDTPLTFFSVAAWFHLLRPVASPEQLRSRDPWLAGLFTGLALLSKSAAVFLLPPLALLACFPRERRQLLVRLALPLGLALLVAGWWYVRNVRLVGDPFQARAQFETFPVMGRHSPMGGPEWEALVRGIADSFFGFWHQEIRIAEPLLLLFHLAVGALGAGLLLLAVHPDRRVVLPEPLRNAIPASLLAALGLLLLLVLGYLRFPSPQGRYLYPCLGSLTVLAAAGIVGLRLSRDDSPVWLVLPPIMALLTTASFFAVVVAREFVERSRAAGAGGVLFYEDGGLPAGHPHRVQGFDLPDPAQMGRRNAWRTLDVHPEAVVYSFDLAGADPAGLQVRVLYHNPDPSLPALADVDGRLSWSAQRLWAGKVLVHDSIDVTATPREFAWPIPAAAIEGQRLTLRFEKTRGSVAAVSEIWVERRWLAWSMEAGAPVARNTTARPCRGLCFFRARDRAGRLVAAGCRELSFAAGPGGRGTPALDLPAGNEAGDVEVEAALVPDTSPFASWQAEALPAFSGRIFGDHAADGGYRLTGPEGGGRIFEVSVPASASGPAFFEVLCRKSSLVVDARCKLGPGDRTPDPLRLLVALGGKEELLAPVGAERWAQLRTSVASLERGAKLSLAVPVEQPLADVDRIELFAAPGLLERLPQKSR